MTQEIEVVIANEAGLHLRPAALFVQTASGYESDIKVRNLTRNTDYQNAKSTIGVMMLQCAKGDIISIQAVGGDASTAVAGLKQLVENNFVTL
ncbi:MAG: HPr family phosphocarrier protein [Chitinophagaceae bacterium]|nr:HPr family phosphocarrier protein [Anaerolineae bacterium]